MAELFDIHVLYRSDTVSIRDIDCHQHAGAPSQEEQSMDDEIVFPRRGVFIKHVRGENVVANSNHVLFFNAAEPYRVSHPTSEGDRCTVFAFPGHIVADALSHYDPSALDRHGSPFQLTHGPAQPRVLFEQHRLRRQVRNGFHDALAVDEQSMRLLERTIDDAHQIRGVRPQKLRPQTKRARRNQMEAAKSYLAVRFRQRVALDDVARAAHCSAFHLARVFRNEIGIPIHQYLNRLRLGAALEWLAEGADNLTQLALDLGYSSHSHFTHAFRQEFRISPSQFRYSANRATLLQMSKNLKV